MPPVAAPLPSLSRPLCVIDRSLSIDQAEVDLGRALFVTVGGSRPVVTAQHVLDEVARNFGVDVRSMAIMNAAVEDFLLTLPDRRAADRVLNEGRPLYGPGFTLLFRRWSRFAHAEGAVLQSLIEVELWGIPVHAWELSTAQQLLSDSCWV
jgi:hypothetical protein